MNTQTTDLSSLEAFGAGGWCTARLKLRLRGVWAQNPAVQYTFHVVKADW